MNIASPKPLLPDKDTSAGGIRNFLVFLLVLRMASYFMLSDSPELVQALKAGLRLGLTLLLLVMALIRLRNSHSPFLQFSAPAAPLAYVLYLVFGIASLLWSSSVASSLLHLLMDIEGFAFAFLYMHLLYSLRRQYPHTDFSLQRVIAPAVLITGLGFIAGLLLDPGQFYRLTHGGNVSRLGGYIINPNELGMLFVIGIACYLPLLVKDTRIRVSVLAGIALLVYLLMLTGSRSAFVALVCVLMLHALLSGSRWQRGFLFIAALALIPIAGWSFFVKQDQWSELYTFTGRLPFWSDLLTYNFPREWGLGYGYMRIDYTDKFESLNAYAGAMTHNTFLQVLLGLGLAGLGVVLVQLSLFLHSLYRMTDRSAAHRMLLVFVPLFINSLTEFGIFGETNYGILFYLFLVFAVSTEPTRAFVRKNATRPDEKRRPSPYRSPSLT